ncbi:hypothetical protein FSP39_016639 [Pinctada imbricata]|uniref:TIR domain-containing protein n=1 Tax=Pinctada imbricata TaxID=66713 RepID=A0AA88Y775_PINIB|nr:hypothetical protein FSP39_016639 [Pinctada imbricata]
MAEAAEKEHNPCTEIAKNEEDKENQFQLYVIYDEQDEFVNDVILPLLEENDISFCCDERHGDPGNTRMGDFVSLLQKSNKILFVVSKYFTSNVELVFLVNVALDVLQHNTQKILTLVTDGVISYKNNLYSLNQSTRISIRSRNWKKELFQAISAVQVDYCALLETGKVSDQLLLRGLCLLNLRWEAYGLYIVADESYLKVDLVEYSKHIDLHHELGINKTCEQCGYLTNVNTTINLAFCDDFAEGQLSEVGNDMVSMCVALLDTRSLMKTQTEWMIVCSVSGLYDKRQQEYISDLFAAAKFAVETDYAAKATETGNLHLPDYDDETKRLESFYEVWPKENVPSAEVMAKSGFVFLMEPDVAQCFSCGYNQCNWDPEKDPLLVHAQVTPACKFVQENVPPENLPNQRVKTVTRNDIFSAPESRISSLQASTLFDVKESQQKSSQEEVLVTLADAGFYFIGYNMIKCYSCGICISYNCIKEGSDIWCLHGTLSPKCEYLLSKRGESFIRTLNHVTKTNNEPTIVTLFLMTLKGDRNIDWPGITFLPGERYKLCQ